MSAERAVFKAIDELVVNFGMQSESLVKQAIKEFMDEHPEVEQLKFVLPEVAGFRVVIGGETKFPRDLVEKDEKLSKCIEAMQEKFQKLQSIIVRLYGENHYAEKTYVAITRFR